MKPVTYLAIKNFREFQHYHDDRPVAWIKLYAALLDDDKFLELPEVAQAQLMKLWLLAARTKNRIRNDTRFIQGKIGSQRPPMIALLLERGWLVDCSKDSSETLEPALEESLEPTLDQTLALTRSREERREEKRREEGRRSRPPASKPRESWLTPLADAYEQIQGKGSFDAVCGEFVKYWHKLVKVHGGEKCAAVWAFAHTTGTERERDFRTPKFVASHFKQFDPSAPAFPAEDVA